MSLYLGETHHDIRVLRRGDQLRVTLDDGRVLKARVVQHGDGSFTVTHDGVRLECAGAPLGAERQLWVNGRLFRYRREAADRHHAPHVAGGPMASTIPAVVREVLVHLGDMVCEGQKLLLLESMKMVLPVTASRDGRVSAIRCAPGEAVAPGVPLVELEAA